MKTAIKIYYYYSNPERCARSPLYGSYCVAETATQYIIVGYIICARIAEYRSSAELGARHFVKSGHVFVENVENLLFASYLFAYNNIVSQVYITLYISHGICGAFVIEIMEYIVH